MQIGTPTRGAQTGAQRRWLIWLLTGLMLVISLIELPTNWLEASFNLQYLQPVWILLVLLYWSMAIPRAVGLLLPWLAGLALDVSTNSLLGQHAFAIVLPAFLAQKSYLQLRNLGLLAQMLVIGLLVSIYQIQLFWVDTIVAPDTLSWSRLLPVVSTTLLWPFFFWWQRSIRRRWKIR